MVREGQLLLLREASGPQQRPCCYWDRARETGCMHTLLQLQQPQHLLQVQHHICCSFIPRKISYYLVQQQHVT